MLAHHVRLVHEGEKELHVPVPSHVILEVFFGREGHSNVLEVDRTTHDLQAIVEGGDNFHVLNGRARPDAIQAESIGLVAVDDVGEVHGRIGHLTSPVSDGDVAQRAAGFRAVEEFIGAISIEISRAKYIPPLTAGIGNALSGVIAIIRVQLSVAIDDHAPPQAAGVVRRGPVERIAFISEDNGTVRSSVGLNLATAGHDQTARSIALTGFGLDDRTRVDGEHIPCIHVDKAIQYIQGVTRQRAGARSGPSIVREVDHGAIGQGGTSAILGRGWKNQQAEHGHEDRNPGDGLQNVGHRSDWKCLQGTKISTKWFCEPTNTLFLQINAHIRTPLANAN